MQLRPVEFSLSCRPGFAHKLVVDALARVLTSADIPLEMEVAINWKQRPADILARRLEGSAPLAIDGQSFTHSPRQATRRNMTAFRQRNWRSTDITVSSACPVASH